MVKKLASCVLLNKIKSNLTECTNTSKYGYIRNYLAKKKGCIVIDKTLNAKEIAEKKVFNHIKADLKKISETKELEISVKANKSGTLYESLSLPKVVSVLKSKKGLLSTNMLVAKLEENDTNIQEIKCLGSYKLKIYYNREEITCLTLAIKSTVV